MGGCLAGFRSDALYDNYARLWKSFINRKQSLLLRCMCVPRQADNATSN
jgi:hypothetical protein